MAISSTKRITDTQRQLEVWEFTERCTRTAVPIKAEFHVDLARLLPSGVLVVPLRLAVEQRHDVERSGGYGW